MNSEQTALYYRENASARLGVLLLVCLSSFLAPVALSSSLVAIPAISQDLQADAVLASWIPAAFLLSNLLTMLPAGRLADIYGRKRIFLLGLLIFLVGVLLAGFAPNIYLLLLFRVIQGVGGAMFFSTGMALVTSVYQKRGRGAALGWVVSCVYAGLTSGPLLGGWLTDQFGWHTVFLFQVPLLLLASLLAWRGIKGEWKNAKPVPLDWWGTLLLSIGIIGFYAGMSSVPDWWALAGFGVAAVFLYLFVRHCNTADNPLIKLKIVWENRPFSGAVLASVFAYASSYGLIFLLGLFLQYNLGMSPTQAGQMLMLQAAIMAVLAPLAGRLSDHYPPYWLAGAGCLSMAAGLALLLTVLDEHVSLVMIGVALLLMGTAFGLFSTPNNSGALGSVSEERLGIASALMNMSRLMGQMLGTGVATLLLSLFIGNAHILPEQYPALLTVMRWATGVSLLLALVAAWYSMRWGRKAAEAV